MLSCLRRTQFRAIGHSESTAGDKIFLEGTERGEVMESIPAEEISPDDGSRDLRGSENS